MFTSPAAPWLFLSCLPRFGAAGRRELSAELADLSALLTMNAASLRSLGLTGDALAGILAWQQRQADHPLIQQAVNIQKACDRHGIGILAWPDPDYPEPLRHIHDAPLVLYTLGDTCLLARDQVAIVGSRKATPAGLDHARQFAAALAAQGWLVTSGLALGIDGAAHAGALDAGRPTTAVIGCGLDQIYPRQHRRLAERIVARGLVVSEYPPGTPARAAHFPQRNRIISGLSRGVLVVEAGLRSGSLITARMALEQGREVFAIPGSVHSPVARGCHHLIKQGAALVETIDDILAELDTAWQPLACARASPGPTSGSGRLATLDSREIAVFEALGYDPQSTDALSSATGLPADQLMQSLLLLELQGLASASAGGYQKIA